MIDRDELMEVCGRDAPYTSEELNAAGREICGEISLEGSRFCVLDPGHTGPHAYESLKRPLVTTVSKAPPTTDTGLVLHCKRCKSPLTTVAKSTKTGYWCDHCCFPPSLDDTYLAKPRPNFKPQPPNPFEDTIDGQIQNLLGYFLG